MSNRLPVLQGEIAQYHRDVQRHTAAAAEKALAAGAALIEAKALCGHGQWGHFLAEAGIPERSAQRYMRMHRLGLETAIVADLGVAEADRMAGLMERLWPDAGCGKHAIGTSGKDMFASVVWRPSSEPYAFFVGMHLGEPCEKTGIPTFGRNVFCARPMAAFGVAMAHKMEFGALQVTSVFDFEGEQDATEHLAHMCTRIEGGALRLM